MVSESYPTSLRPAYGKSPWDEKGGVAAGASGARAQEDEEAGDCNLAWAWHLPVHVAQLARISLRCGDVQMRASRCCATMASSDKHPSAVHAGKRKRTPDSASETAADNVRIVQLDNSCQARHIIPLIFGTRSSGSLPVFPYSVRTHIQIFASGCTPKIASGIDALMRVPLDPRLVGRALGAAMLPRDTSDPAISALARHCTATTFARILIRAPTRLFAFNVLHSLIRPHAPLKQPITVLPMALPLADAADGAERPGGPRRTALLR
ncbi:hypothetical protein B0H11DRAFT_1903395 [Mycena galericulata]|nr:hypothetical protein B0H11DRAFT_1903395 [Mycena galericulata]